MVVQLRSGKEVNSSRAEKKEMFEQEEVKETREDDRKNNSECTAKTENKIHTEQHGKNSEQQQKKKGSSLHTCSSLPTKTFEGKEGTIF